MRKGHPPHVIVIQVYCNVYIYIYPFQHELITIPQYMYKIVSVYTIQLLTMLHIMVPVLNLPLSCNVAWLDFKRSTVQPGLNPDMPDETPMFNVCLKKCFFPHLPGEGC